MSRDLVFHLGDFKTGSTALQDWLVRHGAEHGIFCPAVDHAALAQSLADPAARAAGFATLAEELQDSGLPHAVVSAEHFEFADPALLLAAIETHLPGLAPALRLVAYVRPHAEALLARYGESVKIGNFTGDLDSYMAWSPTRWRLSYAPRFGRWRAVFGDRFTLRLYRRADFPGGDVIRDFAGFVTGRDPGHDPGHDPGPPAEPLLSNPAPGQRDLALLLALHRAIGALPQHSPMAAARWTLGRHLGRMLADRARGASPADMPLRLHRALADRLLVRFAKDAAATDVAFFAGTPLSAALAAAPGQAVETAMSLDPADHLSRDARAVIDLWAGMLRSGLQSADTATALMRIYHE